MNDNKIIQKLEFFISNELEWMVKISTGICILILFNLKL